MRDYDLRALQLTELRILKAVTDFCEENGIVYFLAYGTLLGAARHKGFIPWDDDIDICMDMENYRRFMELAPSLPKPLFFQNYRTDPKVPFFWSKVRMDGTTSMDRWLSSLDVHYGVGIDVFAVVDAAETKFGRAIQSLSARYMNVFIQKYSKQAAGDSLAGVSGFLARILPESVRLRLLLLFEGRFFLRTRKHKRCFICDDLDVNDARTVLYPAEFFDPADRIRMKFEDCEFWAPRRYDEVLTAYYGDWRTPPPEGAHIDHGDQIVDLDRDYREYYTGQ